MYQEYEQMQRYLEKKPHIGLCHAFLLADNEWDAGNIVESGKRLIVDGHKTGVSFLPIVIHDGIINVIPGRISVSCEDNLIRIHYNGPIRGSE